MSISSSVNFGSASELRPIANRNRSPTEDELFAPRVRQRQSLSADAALIHLLKGMLGTGMLSLPLAFKHAGLWLSIPLLALICTVCIYCTRQLIFAQHYVGWLKSQQTMDYANVMRSAVELGPGWLRGYGYAAKQLVNANIFVCQLGFCCVYFVFMADNLKQFFDETSNIHMSSAAWIAVLLVPVGCLCTIRELRALAPLSTAANVVYACAVVIVMQELFRGPHASWELPAVGRLADLPLFFGTVMFAFEGVAVVLPIENQMSEPVRFISPTGVFNTACLVVFALYSCVGFFGFLRFGNEVQDTITLDLPATPFYQVIKLMFVACILVSYPLQFYVPMERVEKFIHRKAHPSRQEPLIYMARGALVLFTCAVAECVPHLALFISLVGSFAGTTLTLFFPPIIEILCRYAQGTLDCTTWLKNLALLTFALVGFTTGTYASMLQILAALGS